jgi:hypothetical protein
MRVAIKAARLVISETHFLDVPRMTVFKNKHRTFTNVLFA